LNRASSGFLKPPAIGIAPIADHDITHERWRAAFFACVAS
jgi:hypothetical protein